MKLSLLACVAVAASTLALASSARANTVTIDYQGFIDPSPEVDAEDLFGGGDLGGATMSAVVVYDTSLGADVATTSSEDLSGGAGFYDQTTGLSLPSPIVSETFTINGFSYSFAPNYYADVYTEAGAGIQQEATDLAGDDTILTYLTPDAPATLNYSFSSTNGAGGGYLLTAFDSANNSDSLTFTLTGATVSAAPESSTWVFALLGVGLTGLVLRRARTQRAVSLSC